MQKKFEKLSGEEYFAIFFIDDDNGMKSKNLYQDEYEALSSLKNFILDHHHHVVAYNKIRFWKKSNGERGGYEIVE